eukprot:4472151-Alexandrium_andersonii.AAC.1
MDRVAFPIPDDALRAFSDLLAWHRTTQDAAEALGRQGRASLRARAGPPAARAATAPPAREPDTSAGVEAPRRVPSSPAPPGG